MVTDNQLLTQFNTFGLAAHCQHFVTANSAQALMQAWQQAKAKGQPVLFLGHGSNVLFLDNFAGTVILNRIQGVEIKESDDAWLLHVGAGESWHQLVCDTQQKNIPGLENLALIPGCVGSAPIQNIGAYGVEFKDVCDYVDVMNLTTGDISRLTTPQCEFGYRESIFKHQFRDGYAIVAVGLRLTKAWQPKLGYGNLSQFDAKTVTSQEIFTSVCETRMSKLPDPAVTGNAGSFFKNPVVSSETVTKLLSAYPTIPQYPQADGSVKLAAGWLIDQCGLKGYQIGGAAVHEKQALVLINKDNATCDDIADIAAYVRNTVIEKFGIALEPEVRFIADHGEVSAVDYLSKRASV